MYEKNREASALAEIARAIAAGQLQNIAPSTKPSQPTGLEHHDGAPLVASKQKKTAPVEATHEEIEPQKKKKKKDKTAEKVRSQHPEQQEIIEPPLTSPPPPSAAATAPHAFHDWYLSTLADNFESEIEDIDDIGSKVLISALESNLALFSSEERKVALAAAHGNQTVH